MEHTKYPMLDQFSTEELERILQDHALNDGEYDDAVISYILDLLQQRDQRSEADRKADTDRAWQEFQQIYLPAGEAGCCLYPTDEEEETDEERDFRPAKRPRMRIGKIIAIAAVIAVLMSQMAAVALGYENLFQMIGKWTGETFCFTQEAEALECNNGLDLIQQTLAEYGVTEKVVPTWLPEGFELDSTSIEKYSNDSQIKISARYHADDEYLIIEYFLCKNDEMRRVYEKTASTVSLFTVDNVNYYLFDNTDESMIAWTVANTECSIHGTFKPDLAKQIIESISK